MKKQVFLKISGKVQGVLYRDSARMQAIQFGLTGWVRNVNDGSVEMLVQGPEEQLQKMIEWCWNGPSSANVENIGEQWKTLPPQEKGFRSFDIIR